MYKQILLISILLYLTGCASTYPCGEPDNGKCVSVSSNYDKSFSDYKNADDLPKDDSWFSSSDNKSTPIKMNFTKYSQIPVDGSPLVSQPTMMRVWLTPYTDSDNIYHGQSYEYMLTDKGHWLFGNNSLEINSKLKNISLIQGSKNTVMSDSGYGLPPKTDKPTNPNGLLNDYPAFNALKNQPVQINKTVPFNPTPPTSQTTTTIYAN